MLPILAAVVMMAQPTVRLHDFADTSAWRLNADGGQGAHAAPETDPKLPHPSMRIRYVDAPPHWGNLVGPCTVPPDAVALRFTTYKHRSAANAAMHIWLLEADNDSWMDQVLLDGVPVGQAKPGPHVARIAVGAFRFEPRGPGTRQMTHVDRMLIGCNYGDLEVTVSSMVWETRTGPTSAPLPTTPGLTVIDGPRGRIGVLTIDGALPGRFAAAHPPAELAAVLRKAGFGATMLRAGDLVDPDVLTPQRLDAVVLPYGPYFPAPARGTFLGFLKAGGSFFSTDGYAFDRLVEWNGSEWTDQSAGTAASDTDRPTAAAGSMNTRTGTPGDAMTFQPDQIGVFDPQEKLESITSLRPVGLWSRAHWRDVGAAGRAQDPIAGFSSSGLIGDNSPVFPPVYRRWVPVLESRDADGVLRGTALSILHNYTGAFAGSSWAFSGMQRGAGRSLLTPGRRDMTMSVLNAIVRKTYLHQLRTDLACYRIGEPAEIAVDVSNFGRWPTSSRVRITVAGRLVATNDVSVGSGETSVVRVQVAVTAEGGDYRTVRAEMIVDGHAIDSIGTAFCVWDSDTIAKGPRIEWKDNYLRVDGRPTFLAGSNQTGMMFYSEAENPAVWDRDFREMAAHNLHILRILHFSPFAKNGFQGDSGHSPLDLRNRPERLRRQMDAIVMLAHKHGVAIALTLHDWQGLGLTDEELAAQADWDRFWAARYRNIPGILFDVQNEPSVDVPDRPDILALWNSWLKDRYGSDEALRAAWSVNPPEAVMPSVPLGRTTNDWLDARSADRKRFEAVILNRWVKANVDGIKAGNPNAIAFVGYLPSMPPADKILGTRYTDLSNMHFYGSLQEYPLELKLVDRRAYDKGFSLGEFGAQEAHDARNQGLDTVPIDASVRRFGAVVHYAMGMGAAFVCNWSWKEFDEMIFPWGLLQRGSRVPKPWLYAYSQDARFAGSFAPVYQPSSVYLLAPDRNRIGPHFDELHGALQRSAGLLMDCRVNFGVLNEEDLSSIPPSARVIFWPLPYCPDDATFDRLLEWVRAGGTLYLSGDMQFDATRHTTRSDRRVALGLPAAEAQSPFAVPASSWAKPTVETTVGKGHVLYVPYPMELRPRDQDVATYRRAIALGAADAIIRVEPPNAPVRVMSIPTEGGGRLYTLARTGGPASKLRVALPDCRATVELSEEGSAFVSTDRAGRVVGIESDGLAMVDGRAVASAASHYGIIAGDGRALTESRSLRVLPHLNERVDVAGLRLPAAAAVTWHRPDGHERVGKLGVGFLRFAIGESCSIEAPSPRPIRRGRPQ